MWKTWGLAFLLTAMVAVGLLLSCSAGGDDDTGDDDNDDDDDNGCDEPVDDPVPPDQCSSFCSSANMTKIVDCDLYEGDVNECISDCMDMCLEGCICHDAFDCFTNFTDCDGLIDCVDGHHF